MTETWGQHLKTFDGFVAFLYVRIYNTQIIKSTSVDAPVYLDAW
jgi:hypothetical protein